MQNGYKARVVKIENCGGEKQVLKVDSNSTITLNKNCEVVIKGCGETTGFKTCNVSNVSGGRGWTIHYIILKQVKYTILKNGNRITSGTTDVCAELENDSKGITTALMSFGLPKNCPVDAVKFSYIFIQFISSLFLFVLKLRHFHWIQMRQCSDGSQTINISKHKTLLPLAVGNIDISIDGTHDTVS